MSAGDAELEALSQPELLARLRAAQMEIAALRSNFRSAASSTAGPTPTVNPLGGSHDAATPAGATPAGASATPPRGRKYTLSGNVLAVGGTEAQRVCRSVPLVRVLQRAVGRPDEREADTPVAARVRMGEDGAVRGYFHDPAEEHDGDALRHPRFSVEVGRFSGQASDGSPQSSVNRAGRPSGALSAAGDSPQGVAPEELRIDIGGSSVAARRMDRPAPLVDLKVPSRLEPDAIMSVCTAQSFARRQGSLGLGGSRSGCAPMMDTPGHWNRRADSPTQSRAAASIHQYLADVFARENNFAHDLTEAEREQFGRSLLAVCDEVEAVLQQEPRHAAVPSPCYVFGDLHGNYRDLHYFLANLINFDDLRFTPHRLLFLGDYVDRGPHGVEVVALLFALKALAPGKVALLRGNHEDTLVNGDLNLYRDTSFRHQCHALFGPLLGERVWERCNAVFARMPLTANIDERIFCTHGGLPRFTGGEDDRMEWLTRPDFPVYDSFFKVPENESEFSRRCRQVASDVCWSDPAEEDGAVDDHGFGPNPRGNGVILFGTAAVDEFLETHGYDYIFRAHQEKSDGLKISKNSRVVTIFSTSAYVGHQNGAGVVFVGDGKIRVIIKEADNKAEHEKLAVQ